MNTIEYIVETKLIRRIIKTCLREKLLNYQIDENGRLRVELMKSKAFLVAEKVRRLPLSNYQIGGDLHYIARDLYK